MAGTQEGGIAAAETNKLRYGMDYYARIGAMGGKVQTQKGFALMSPEERKKWGTVGGALGRRKSKKRRV